MIDINAAFAPQFLVLAAVQLRLVCSNSIGMWK